MFIIESVTVEVLGRLGKAGRGLSVVVESWEDLAKLVADRQQLLLKI